MERAIGIIDSGIGGLTVVKEVMRQLPHEPIVYLGDTARCPYGPRDTQEVRQFTQEMVDFLLEKHKLKMLIVACNTATAVMLESLKRMLPIPVLGVVHPGARAAVKKTKNKRIGVIGTIGTINSQAYEKALFSIDTSIKVTSLPCPAFVPLAEQGRTSGEDNQAVVSAVLGTTFQSQEVDALILGCTHYPMLTVLIQKAVGENVILISSGEETAREASTILHYQQIESSPTLSPTPHFYTTGQPSLFKQMAERWLEKEIHVSYARLEDESS
ncbi:glutamate racemase [Aureibacillus halotolerans]|uniref:Glutamate racemase n=1 Tax=Aureibacillus halotolerans TaxID=1508390 RepID=A0A4R6U425_9BACI|nr:glutamate racemase [Aureibacillus halotolerans]TDQ39185.1 glutamate racemase [Aureibacillus halotolerans]